MLVNRSVLSYFMCVLLPLFLSACASIGVHHSGVYVLLEDYNLNYVMAWALIFTHYYFLDLDPRLFYFEDLNPHLSCLFVGL